MSVKQWQKLPENMQNEAVKPYFDSLTKKKFTLFVKRMMDIIIASIVILILSPILLGATIAVAVGSKGPVFYLQRRVGRFGKEFSIFKFRTMVVNADKIGAQITVGEDDPRITKVGKILRTTRIDEFPQMFNILKGDMTLVGTRPEVRKYVNEYSDEMMATLLLRPGATGAASLAYRYENEMLSGKEDPEKYYIETILPDKMAINLEYTRKLSIWEDVKILAKTVACVVKK